MAKIDISGLVLDIRSLGRRPGSLAEVHATTDVAHGIGLDSIGIEAHAPIALDLQLQSVSEGVLVTGTVSADTAGECSRCLDPVTGHVSVYLTELFAYPHSLTEKTTEEDEVGRVVDDRIDLTQVITDAVGLELPLRPLCEPNCQGLCAECGVRLAIAGSDHSHAIIDPRWAALADKFATPDASTDS